MEHIDPNQRIDMLAPKASSSALRWVMRIMLVLCGTVMAIVLLSEPRVVSYAQSSADQVGQYFTSFSPNNDDQNSNEAFVAPAEIIELHMPTPRTEPAVDSKVEPVVQVEETVVPKPSVRAMPTNRIPVRRAGQASKD